MVRWSEREKIEKLKSAKVILSSHAIKRDVRQLGATSLPLLVEACYFPHLPAALDCRADCWASQLRRLTFR